MSQRTILVVNELADTIERDFGVRDKYGYNRGYRAKIFLRQYDPRPENHDGGCWSEVPAGVWFDIEFQNLREPKVTSKQPISNWDPYQAWTNVRGKHDTLVGAKAAAEKTIEAARKRLVKDQDERQAGDA